MGRTSRLRVGWRSSVVSIGGLEAVPPSERTCNRLKFFQVYSRVYPWGFTPKTSVARRARSVEPKIRNLILGVIAVSFHWALSDVVMAEQISTSLRRDIKAPFGFKPVRFQIYLGGSLIQIWTWAGTGHNYAQARIYMMDT